MEITKVRITLKEKSKLKAFASVIFDNCFILHGLKVISGSDGLFVSMPSRRTRNGTFQDIVHPLTNEMREKIETAILDAYENELGRCESAVITADSSGNELSNQDLNMAEKVEI